MTPPLVLGFEYARLATETARHQGEGRVVILLQNTSKTAYSDIYSPDGTPDYSAQNQRWPVSENYVTRGPFSILVLFSFIIFRACRRLCALMARNELLRW